MKIALCLHGYFANTGGIKASVDGHAYIKRKLLDRYDVDVFIHSWDLENKDLVFSLYNPVESVFEEQNNFDNEVNEICKSPLFSRNKVFQGLSFLYSRKQAVQIKTDFEERNGFKYDCVVLARFDLGQRGKEHPQVYYATNFNFDPKLDMDYVYSAFWNQMNHGYADHWFFSNSDNMNVVSNLYDKVKEYYKPDSEYVDKVINGWPDSNGYDQFSNEMFLDKKSLTLKKFSSTTCVDNHKLYKWYFIDNGLYDKSRFVDITEDR